MNYKKISIASVAVGMFAAGAAFAQDAEIATWSGFRHNDEQYKGVVEDDGSLLVLAFAETDGKKRVATHANHHGHGHNEKGNREADGDAADAEATDALAYEIAVHNVVERFDEHTDDSRDRKLQDNLRDASRPHRVKLFVVYDIFH